VPKKTTIETAPFSFRLSATDRVWLEEIAAKNGVDVAQIVRWALEALRQYVDAHDGRLHLPIDIKDFWERAESVRPFPALRVAEPPPTER